MEQLLLKAATTATTDQGEFTAIAAAYSVDRVGDRIIPGAFAKTISAWQQSGKQIPLHWNHEGAPDRIIGSIDPAAMTETDAGLYVKGQLDLQDSEIAREAWRSMKAGRMSLSFGYAVQQERKAKDGVNELLAIDLFEVSIVPAPANADTRVLSTKGADDPPEDEPTEDDPVEALTKRITELEATVESLKAEPPTSEPPAARSDHELRERSRQAVLEVQSDGASLRKPPEQVKAEPAPEPAPELELKRQSRRAMLELLTGGDVA